MDRGRRGGLVAREGTVTKVKLSRFLSEERPLVVYSEGATYRPHLAPIAEEYASRGWPVAYVTSEKKDWDIPFYSDSIFSFFIGSGVRRTWFFQTVDCDVFLTTMPDLDQLHLKRSIHPVHYVYTQHSLSSLHMVYREGAFDSYDTIFAAGSYHVHEVRAIERSRGTAAKEVVEQGYVFLDALKRSAQNQEEKIGRASVLGSMPAVLVAPSWGPEGLLENYGEAVVGNLLEAGFSVILRPHPRTIQLSRKTIGALLSRFSSHPDFSFDGSANPVHSYIKSDVLVSSWSGAAFEYGLAFGKPVVHVDVPRKTRNPHYKKIELEPFEVAQRGVFGVNFTPDRIPDVALFVQDALTGLKDSKHTANAFLNSEIFNPGGAAESAADHLAWLKRS